MKSAFAGTGLGWKQTRKLIVHREWQKNSNLIYKWECKIEGHTADGLHTDEQTHTPFTHYWQTRGRKLGWKSSISISTDISETNGWKRNVFSKCYSFYLIARIQKGYAWKTVLKGFANSRLFISFPFYREVRRHCKVPLPPRPETGPEITWLKYHWSAGRLFGK